jgi:shikimate dehydrogenase
VDGIVAALYEAGVTSVESAVILGSGATAASAAVALAEMGCMKPMVLVRSLDEAEQFASVAKALELAPKYAVAEPEAAARVMARVDTTICTAPAGAADPIASALDASGSAPRGVLLDVVYDPRPTAISAAWSAAGGTVVGGERMLLHQAVKQVRLMTGRRAPVDAMDAALQAALG